MAALRFWFSSNRIMFHIAADEPAQLAMARFLAGGTRWNMFDHSTWRPGMATLMTPMFWFTENTQTIVRGGLLIAAGLGGLAAVLLARLAIRITRMSPTACVVASAMISLTPSSLSATSFVWAEALVTVTFLGSLLFVIDFYDTDRRRSGAGAIVVAALGFVSHGRLLPLLTIVIVLVLGRSLVRRVWRQAATLAAVAAASTMLAFAYPAWIFNEVWDRPGRSNTIGTVVDRLPRVTDELKSAVGQAWYQIVATAGLVAIGLGVSLAAAIRRRPRDGAGVVSARHARLLLVFTLPLLGVSMAFMSSRTRADHRIYGRYNDAIMWPLLIVAVGWLVRLRRSARAERPARPARLAATVAAVGAMALGGAWAVRVWHGDEFATSVGVRPMIAGLMPVIGTRSVIPVVTLTLVGLGAFAVLVLAASTARRGSVLAVVAAIVLVVAGVRTHEGLNTRLNSWQSTTSVTEIDAMVPPDAVLGVKFVRDSDDPKVKWDEQRRRAQLYQFSLPHHRFVRDDGVDDDVGPYVFAPLGDADLTEAGATVIWKDARIAYGLWEEPTSPAGDDQS